MPTGPKGQKRPADVIGNAVHVMRVLTGEADDEAPDDGKDKAAQSMGRKGGAARAASMTIPQRPHQRWSLDFVSDSFICGRRLRILCVVDDFSREGRRAGVSSTVLCPGPTDTGFFDRAQLRPNRFFRALMMPPGEVARQGLEAMFRRKDVHVPGLLNKLAAFVPRLVPLRWMPRIAYLFCKGEPAAPTDRR